eukprot:bmy_04259T0
MNCPPHRSGLAVAVAVASRDFRPRRRTATALPPLRQHTSVHSGLVSHCEAPLFGTSLREALKRLMVSIFLPPSPQKQLKKTYQCIKCQMTFENEREIQIHVANHMIEAPAEVEEGNYPVRHWLLSALSRQCQGGEDKDI